MHLLFNSDASELLLKTHQDLSVLLPCSLIRFSSLPLTRFLAFRLHRANSRAVLALHRPCVKGNKERVNKTNTVAIYCPLEWVHFTAEPVTRGKFGGRGRVPILLEYGSEVKFDSILHAEAAAQSLWLLQTLWLVSAQVMFAGESDYVSYLHMDLHVYIPLSGVVLFDK